MKRSTKHTAAEVTVERYEEALKELALVKAAIEERHCKASQDTIYGRPGEWPAAGDAEHALEEIRHLGDWLLKRGEYAEEGTNR